ncbi:FAD-binding oxidoreductase, partial [Acidithiobacillus thiooxidans]|uniref:NAD(P)/FAD-dependent oxidoreductase n=3 Tax=Acidithiobacillaceae TaxID=225058 RepID=UPI001C07EA18
HYRQPATSLCHPVLDADQGYVLAPMQRGIRLTTGAEFADRDAPRSSIPLTRAEAQARRLLPSLGERLDPEAWLGSRPCTPDMLPIIGPAPGQKGLWYAFGHCHQGLTLGPTTGRLLAEMMGDETPFTDPEPYRAERFM